MDQTSTVEILNRCSVCVASKRSAQYCRVTLAHTAPRATVCASCLDNQATVTECRLKEGHRDPGVSTNVAVSDLQSYKLPQCCTQLTSLSLSKDKAGLSTYTGFMRGYTTKKTRLTSRMRLTRSLLYLIKLTVKRRQCGMYVLCI
jgi:hypothetical protein